MNDTMREIINLSLSPEMASTVKKEVRRGKYSSTSEFFRSLIRAWMEERLLVEINKGREEIAAGKGRVLHSLKDLR